MKRCEGAVAAQLTFCPLRDRIDEQKRHPRRVVVALNENGRRIGQTHHNAWIPDVIVDLIRAGHEDYGWGYLQLSAMFFLSKNTVRKICSYERRAQTPTRWITRKVVDAQGDSFNAGPGRDRRRGGL